MRPTRGSATVGAMRRGSSPGAARPLAATAIAALHDGVAHRARPSGGRSHPSRRRSEVTAGRWRRAGRHTVVIGTGAPTGEALLWQAVWESGSGAVLDGVAALGRRRPHRLPSRGRSTWRSRHATAVTRRRACDCVGGATSALPSRSGCRGCDPRRRRATRRSGRGVTGRRRSSSVSWCSSDWSGPNGCSHTGSPDPEPSARLPHAVIRDVCDGVHSLGELDFARLCRARGLPEPSRQAVRRPAGRTGLSRRRLG